MGYAKCLRVAKAALKAGYDRIKNVTNPIVSNELVGNKIDDFGDEISVFCQKRKFGKPKTIEIREAQIEVSEQELKDESLFVWEGLFGDITATKNLEITPVIQANLNKLIASGKISKEYAEIFTQNINKGDTDFIQGCYDDLAKHLGYKKYPDLAYGLYYGSSSFNPSTITISLEAFTSKSNRIVALRHELEHFRQEELVYRIMGEEKYINAKIKPNILHLEVNDEFCRAKFNKTFSELTEQEVEKYKSYLYEKYKKSCEIFKGARIKESKPTPKEIEDAKKYLQAIENYKTPTMILDDTTPNALRKLAKENPEKYNLLQQFYCSYANNPLERGAVAKGNEMEHMFDRFVELF